MEWISRGERERADLPSPGELPAAVLAGGLGTRLRPLTGALPKVLAPVHGRPFIDWPLRMLARRGFRRVVLLVGYGGKLVRARVGDGACYGLELAYAHDPGAGGAPSGTAAALRGALPLLGERFWVVNGDTYLDTDYAAVLADSARAPAANLMVAWRCRGAGCIANLALGADGRCTYRKDRPDPTMRHVDAGAALLTAEALHSEPDEPSLAALYERLGERSQLAGYEVRERFHEINTPAGLRRTARYLARRTRREAAWTP